MMDIEYTPLVERDVDTGSITIDGTEYLSHDAYISLGLSYEGAEAFTLYLWGLNK